MLSRFTTSILHEHNDSPHLVKWQGTILLHLLHHLKPQISPLSRLQTLKSVIFQDNCLSYNSRAWSPSLACVKEQNQNTIHHKKKKIQLMAKNYNTDDKLPHLIRQWSKHLTTLLFPHQVTVFHFWAFKQDMLRGLHAGFLNKSYKPSMYLANLKAQKKLGTKQTHTHT